MRERSTVGSASATGSVGGRTTWASGSDVYDPDKMSEDQDNETRNDDTSSMGGFSDEGAASLVGFGEGARTPARQQSATGVGSPVVGKASAVPPHMRDQAAAASPLQAGMVSAGSTLATSSLEGQQRNAKMIDGMTYDTGLVDTTTRPPPPTATMTAGGQDPTASERSPTGAEVADRIMREKFENGEDVGRGAMHNAPRGGIGSFYFEGKGPNP